MDSQKKHAEVFNPANVEITEDEIVGILNKYGLPGTRKELIRNPMLFKRAFVHSSYVKPGAHKPGGINQYAPEGCVKIKSKSNENLEFLGDGMLENITKLYLYRRFSREDEEFMTTIKIAIVQNENIGKIAYAMGLHKWLLICKNLEENKFRTYYNKLGCLFEAFLGAVFMNFSTPLPTCPEEEAGCRDMEGGDDRELPAFKMTRRFLETILETHVDWTEFISKNDNYKTNLQIIIQREFKNVPIYSQIGKDADTGFTTGVYLHFPRKTNHHIGISESLVESVTKQVLYIDEFESFQDIHRLLREGSATCDLENDVIIYLAEGSHKKLKKAEQLAAKSAINVLQKFMTVAAAATSLTAAATTEDNYRT